MILRQETLDRYFRLAVFIKGFDGVVEIIGGLVLAMIPAARVHALVEQLSVHELGEDPNDFISQSIQHLDKSLTPGTETIVVLYLLVHGVIKFLLAYALLSRKYHYYPAAIVGLLSFLFYESYLIGLNHSVMLTVFAGLDIVIIWLTYLEYVRHREIAKPEIG